MSYSMHYNYLNIGLHFYVIYTRYVIDSAMQYK